jgi:hypothetical protein
MISIRDARDTVCRTTTPDWQILVDRLNPASPSYEAFQEQDAKCAREQAWRNYDKAQRRAIKWLRDRISQASLVALVRDPKTGGILQLDGGEWASMTDFEIEVTIVMGARQPVFFDRKEFESVLSEFAQSTTGIDAPSVTEPPPVKDKGGRPIEYDYKAMKAFALQKIKELGRPGKGNKRLPTKAQLIELILKEWRERYGQEPTPSLVRSHLNRWLTEVDKN